MLVLREVVREPAVRVTLQGETPGWKPASGARVPGAVVVRKNATRRKRAMARVRHPPGVSDGADERNGVEALAALGLSPEEAKLYRALVGLGGTGVDDLARRCQLSSPEVGDGLLGLERQGLVAQSASVPGRWVAEPPGIALRALSTTDATSWSRPSS